MDNDQYFPRQQMMLSKPAARILKNMKLLILGSGAGGNEVAKNAVLIGITYITIVDMDTVEDSNLSKSVLFRKEDIGKGKAQVAAERLREMALTDHPDIRFINANLITDVGKGVFLEHDFVIIAFDTQEGRAYANDMCVLTGTPFMELGFRGYNVEISFFAPEGPMQQSDGTIIDSLPTSDGNFPKMLGKFPVCLREEIGTGSFDGARNSCSGFKVRDTDLSKIPSIQTSAALSSALLIQELVKYLDGKDTLRNKMLLFFGLTLQTMVISYTRRPDCTIHDKAFNLVTVPVPTGVTIGDALRAIEEELGSEALLSLPDEYILSGRCHCCGKRIDINARSRQVWDEQRWCGECRSTYPDYALRLTHSNDFEKVPKEVSLRSPADILERRLKDIGVPENDILDCIILSDGESQFYNVYLKTV